MRIGHNGKGVGAGWYLDYVEVHVPSKGLVYKFNAHRWLDENEGDRQTTVEMQPTEVIETRKCELNNNKKNNARAINSLHFVFIIYAFVYASRCAICGDDEDGRQARRRHGRQRLHPVLRHRGQERTVQAAQQVGQLRAWPSEFQSNKSNKSNR